MNKEKLIIGTVIVLGLALAQDQNLIQRVPTDSIQKPNTRLLTANIGNIDLGGIRIAPIANTRAGGLTLGIQTQIDLGSNDGIAYTPPTSHELGIDLPRTNLIAAGSNANLDLLEGRAGITAYARLLGNK